MKIVAINSLENHHKEKVYHLWNTEYPENIRYYDIVQFD
jgi:hypothetical protein